MKCSTIAREVAAVCVTTGVSALASYLLKTSIGVGGGAIYGVFFYLTAKPAEIGINRLVDCVKVRGDKKDQTSVKVAMMCVAFFPINAICWGISNGIWGTASSFSYVNALALGGTLCALGLATMIPVGCYFCCREKYKEKDPLPNPV